MRLQNIGITIQKELIETTRNRWLQGFIIIFVVLSVAIGVISSLQSGSLDLDTINRFDISVLNLTLLIVPLLGMIVGSQNIVGEKADGFLELLFAYPIRWYELVLGKYLGMLLALAIGELVGFGLVGFALGFFTHNLAVGTFLAIIFVAIFLTGIFLAIGLAISSFSRSRGSAIVTSLFVWLFWEVIYDFILIQAIVALQGSLSQFLFNVLIALDPVDAARMILTHVLGFQINIESNSGFVNSVVAPNEMFLIACLLIWFCIPLVFCRRSSYGAR